jgi:hypothetical protein
MAYVRRYSYADRSSTSKLTEVLRENPSSVVESMNESSVLPEFSTPCDSSIDHFIKLPWSSIWKNLSKIGWTQTNASGIIQQWYFPPGIDFQTAVEGETKFATQDEVIRYLRRTQTLSYIPSDHIKYQEKDLNEQYLAKNKRKNSYLEEVIDLEGDTDTSRETISLKKNMKSLSSNKSSSGNRKKVQDNKRSRRNNIHDINMKSSDFPSYDDDDMFRWRKDLRSMVIQSTQDNPQLQVFILNHVTQYSISLASFILGYIGVFIYDTKSEHL